MTAEEARERRLANLLEAAVLLSTDVLLMSPGLVRPETRALAENVRNWSRSLISWRTDG